MSLSHLSDDGDVHMVDISGKDRSTRVAKARGEVQFPEDVLNKIVEEGVPKGELFATARVAGIEGAKQTPEIIPLAHPIQLSHVDVELTPEPDNDRVIVTSIAKARDATGVEMEALTAVQTATLTLYDMCKSEHKAIKISNVRLLKKEGGRSGKWVADSE